MKRFVSSLLLLAPLAVLAHQPAAKAWGWNYYYQDYGNSGYGRVTGPRGYTGTYQRQRVGNTVFSNYSSPYGRSRCTTQYIGQQIFQSCH
ncbi:MAG: hypothetical protein KFB97_03360 [Cyanobium sp. M30B3]|nr:MAG: hypothetical protein KFB97_03360 [Cyanobium sp. M30B3]